MTVTIEQIDRWRGEPSEHQRLEFKEAKTQYDSEKLCQYCVAIANEGGGYLLLGIKDKMPHDVVGSDAFPNPVKIESKLFERLGFLVSVEAVAHPDGRVIVFDIPAKPRGSAYNFKGRYLMRAGDSLVSMSEDQLRKIFAEGQPSWLSEPAVIGIDDQRVIDLLDTQTFFELMELPYPTGREGVLDTLLGEGLISQDDAGFTISRLGAIMIARRLDDFPDIKRKAPRVVVHPDNSKLQSKLDESGTKGYAVGFQGLNDFVGSQLPQNEVIRDSVRKNVKMVPENAIRELVANALIHQDFKESGSSVLIEVYSDRLEISNPGEPIVPVERFIDGYKSRNEKLADLMRRMGICEELGGGIDMVVTEAEIYQLPAPDFRSEFRRTSVVVYGPKGFDQMTRNERIRACYQHCVLKRVMSQPMTNQTLRDRFKLPESKSASVSQVIKMTIDAEQIKLDDQAGGSRKFARYLPFWA